MLDARYRAITEQAFEVLLVIDRARVVGWANAASMRVLGYPPEVLVGKQLVPLVHAGDLAMVDELVERLRGTPGEGGVVTFRLRAADGSWRWMEASVTNLLDDPAVGGFVVAMWDVSAQRTVADALAASEARYRELFEHARDMVYTAALDGTFLSVNPAAEALTGYSGAELLGMTVFDLTDAQDLERAKRILAERVAGASDEPVDLRLVMKDGQRRFVQTTARVVTDVGVGHVEGIVRDMTERHALEERLRHSYLHDALTGLANRVLLHDRLGQALARGVREGSQVAVMLLDIDDFKLVNDGLGHAVGDRLLVDLGRRLVAVARADETVARLGGDEFAVVVEGVRSHRAAATVAERILSVFSESFRVGATELRITASLGIAMTVDATGSQDLLRDADMAMYRAKALTKGGFVFFNDELRVGAVRRLELAEALGEALRAHTLTVDYQPILSLRNNEILGVEALARWHHPTLGWIPPDEFIPLAEDTGLIVPLGRYVLDTAAQHAAKWRTLHSDALPLGVFVNASPRELSEPDFAASVRATLETHGLDGSAIAIEVTERVFIGEDNATLRRNLRLLTNAGIRVVLDDFGTGHSALASLQRFPLAALKIDRLFLQGLHHHSDQAPIVDAVVRLCDALNILVIAEGVETATQLDYLGHIGCDAAQGFLLARPQHANAISGLLRSQPNHTARPDRRHHDHPEAA